MVTGTPVCSNLSEVKGLCQFLALEPYHENTMWNRMVNSIASYNQCVHQCGHKPDTYNVDECNCIPVD